LDAFNKLLDCPKFIKLLKKALLAFRLNDWEIIALEAEKLLVWIVASLTVKFAIEVVPFSFDILSFYVWTFAKLMLC